MSNIELQTLRSGGTLTVNDNNNTTNNYDHSQRKTIDNSTHNATYSGSQHTEYNTNIQNQTNIIGTPRVPAAPPPIDILRERICVEAAFDSAERGNPPRCHKKTRTAILSSSSSWADNIASLYAYLWITGWVGVGKSAILQTLAEEFAKQRRLAASFFFFQGSAGRNIIHRFIPSIAYQLMNSVPGAREIILSKIADNPTIFVDKSFEGQWRVLVVDTLRDLPSPPAPMLIVIDGIDELISHDEQRTLLQAILGSELGPSYKLLLASRPEKQIQSVFTLTGTICDENRIELGNTDDTKADLRLFLQLSLSEIHYRCQQPPLSTPTTQPWPQKDTVEHLVNKASGQFIYASTIVQFVGSSDDPQAALDVIMNGRDIRSNSFKELDYLYLLLMERITKSTQKKHQHLLHHLLVCIYMHLVSKLDHQVDLLHPKESYGSLLKILFRKLDPVIGTNGEYRHRSFIEFLIQPSAPHLFSINSWHISGILSLFLPVFLKHGKNKTSLLHFIERSSPTPGLVFCLSRVPQGKWSAWGYHFGHKISGYLWSDKLIDKWTLGWLGYYYYGGHRMEVRFLVDRKPLQYLQIPLYVLVGLPYYKCLEVKETSPHFYKWRTHDLTGPNIIGEDSN